MITDLAYFKNKHLGKKGFVCGAGTSLKDVPKSIAEEGIVVCVNSSGLYFDSYDYLFITDSAVFFMEYFSEIFEKAKIVIFANPELLSFKKQLNSDKIYLMTRRYDDSKNYKFTDDKLCLGNDACVPATHFSFVLGLNPITLCGIDLCYNNNKRYFSEKSFVFKENSPYKKSFTEELQKSKKTINNKETDDFLFSSIANWIDIWNQNFNIRNNILNSSNISLVPNFKKVTL